MKELQHPNVITLQHAFYTQGDKVRHSNHSSMRTIVNSSSDSDFFTFYSKTRYIWMWWWTTFPRRSTAFLNTTTRWSSPFLLSWSNCTPINPSEPFPTSTRSAIVIATSSLRTYWWTRKVTPWRSVISVLPSALSEVRSMWATYVPGTIALQNSFSAPQTTLRL